MTGFGRYELSEEGCRVMAEVRSVNHRYLDLSVRLPKKLGSFEAEVRSLVKQYAVRGKVEVYIAYEEENRNFFGIRYNPEVARAYYENLKKLGEDFDLEDDIKLSALSRYPDVFTLEEQTIDEQLVFDRIKRTLKSALERFAAARALEGEQLKHDLDGKLSSMREAITFIEERSPQIVENYRKKITEKVEELLGNNQVDQVVLATEITIFADKICVDEETVRLRSHIHNMEKVMEEGAGVGRKLDFIVQEMNREATTILAKSSDLAVSNVAIDLKTCIEKIREQVQNIE